MNENTAQNNQTLGNTPPAQTPVSSGFSFPQTNASNPPTPNIESFSSKEQAAPAPSQAAQSIFPQLAKTPLETMPGQNSFQAPTANWTASDASLSNAPSAVPSQPVTPASQPNMNDNNQRQTGGKGVFILIPIIIVLIGVLGYLLFNYLFSANSLTQETEVLPTQFPQSTPVPTVTYEEQAGLEISSLQDVSTSDEVADLEKDIDATDLSTLDKDVSSVTK